MHFQKFKTPQKKVYSSKFDPMWIVRSETEQTLKEDGVQLGRTALDNGRPQIKNISPDQNLTIPLCWNIYALFNNISSVGGLPNQKTTPRDKRQKWVVRVETYKSGKWILGILTSIFGFVMLFYPTFKHFRSWFDLSITYTI